jgi:polysaccharide biosynthesis/export protein
MRFLSLFLLLASVVGCSTPPSATSPLQSSNPEQADQYPTGYATGLAQASPDSRAMTPESTDTRIPAIIGLPDDPTDFSDHRISAGDVLNVTVFQAPELTTQKRVGDSGSIDMPLIGQVPVVGLNTDQAARKLEAALGERYLQNPQVDIFVSTYANMNLAVAGEVNKPGLFPLVGESTLYQAIAQAGGFTPVANQGEVMVVRTSPDKQTKAYVVDVGKVEKGLLRDPLLVGNDKVIVPKSGSKVVVRGTVDTLRYILMPPRALIW